MPRVKVNSAKSISIETEIFQNILKKCKKYDLVFVEFSEESQSIYLVKTIKQAEWDTTFIYEQNCQCKGSGQFTLIDSLTEYILNCVESTLQFQIDKTDLRVNGKLFMDICILNEEPKYKSFYQQSCNDACIITKKDFQRIIDVMVPNFCIDDKFFILKKVNDMLSGFYGHTRHSACWIRLLEHIKHSIEFGRNLCGLFQNFYSLMDTFFENLIIQSYDQNLVAVKSPGDIQIICRMKNDGVLRIIQKSFFLLDWNSYYSIDSRITKLMHFAEKKVNTYTILYTNLLDGIEKFKINKKDIISLQEFEKYLIMYKNDCPRGFVILDNADRLESIVNCYNAQYINMAIRSMMKISRTSHVGLKMSLKDKTIPLIFECNGDSSFGDMQIFIAGIA